MKAGISKDSRILITGSSGVLGSNVTNYLSELGFENLILLDIAPPKDGSSSKYRFITADITKDDLPFQLFQDVDVIVHCASAAPSYSTQLIYSIIVEGTKNLLNHAHEANVSRFIYISSTAVYGIPKSVPLHEDSERQNYHDPYNRAKIQAEDVCEDFRNKGMCLTILRPRTFLGPGRMGTFAMLNEWASEGRNFPLLGAGKNRYQFLDVEDLCQAIYLCIVKPAELTNDNFNIGAKRFSSIREDYQSVLESAVYGKRIILLPAKPALLMLNLLEKVNLIPLYKRLYEKIVMDYYVSIDKAERILGYEPKYSNRDTLVRCYEWYISNKSSFDNKTGTANNAPWKQGVIGLVKPFF